MRRKSSMLLDERMYQEISSTLSNIILAIAVAQEPLPIMAILPGKSAGRETEVDELNLQKELKPDMIAVKKG